MIFVLNIYREETENGNITGISEFFSLFNSCDGFGSRTSLLQQPVDNFVSGTATCFANKDG